MRIDPVSSGMDVVREEVHVDTSSRAHENAVDVEKALDAMQKKLEKFREVLKSEAEFKVDRSTGMVIVKIKDKETGEVIRQIPPEVVVRLAKTIEEFLGLLLDERV